MLIITVVSTRYEKNVWTKVINNEKLEDVQMNVEICVNTQARIF